MDYFDYYESVRLKPNHEVSQWYMYKDDMRKQVEFLLRNLKHEKILFLGDGDGISILLGLEAQKHKSCLKEIYIFDIDERELNLYNKIAKEFNLNEKIKINTIHYNIFDKVDKKFANYFDFFYINPPYSYTTNPPGFGFALWLERCIEMTKENAEGCIVYPIADGDTDISNVNKFIFDFLNERNFDVLSISSLTHRYHECECLSKNILVKKTDKTATKYANKKFPNKFLKTLYYYNANPPHLIKDNGSTYGQQIKY